MESTGTTVSPVKADFTFAKNHLENAPDLAAKASPETKLKLYGLFKQATCGECVDDAPSMFNVKARMKHDAWVAQSGLSKEAASQAYTKIVLELDPSLRLPSSSTIGSSKKPRPTTPTSSGLKGSTHSLTGLGRSESQSFLDRLLGPPPRLTSPASSRDDQDTEEKSSVGSGPHVQPPLKKKIMGRNASVESLKATAASAMGRNPSVESLKKMSESGEGAFSSASSAVTTSAPTTPQGARRSSILSTGAAGGSGSGAKMRKVSSLTWAVPAEERVLQSPHDQVMKSGLRARRRNSDGDNFDLNPPVIVDPNEEDAQDDDSDSQMEWDSDAEYDAVVRRTGGAGRKLYIDNDEEEDEREEGVGSHYSDDDSEDEYDDDDEEEDEYGERRMRRHSTSGGEDAEEKESVIGTFLFTMPFVFAVRVYQLISSVVMYPVTFPLHYLGFKVKKVPDTLSVREKKQAASLLAFVSLIPLTPIVYMWMFFFLIFPFTTIPTAMYIAWLLYWDESPRNGQRKPLLRDIPLAKYFIEYFPITLWRRSPPLDPNGKYVFAYHPHGIIGLGSFGAFATHAAGFQEKFPGIDIRLLTLDSNFRVPILREVLLGFGVCSCSRKACDNILNRGPGSAICLVVGGAAESLETQKGTYRLVLGRKGFIQVAVENNADLVPVIAFGETDAFETFSAAPGTMLREVQTWIQRKIKFTVPIFWGRGFFNTNFGFLPKRRPIHVVTGEPLSIKPFRDQGLEGEELVNAVHRAYVAALRRLFDENKDECEAGIKRKESITIIK